VTLFNGASLEIHKKDIILMIMNDKYKQSKRLRKTDGTIAYVFDGKLHNWEGPALIPEGNERKREYYLHGIQYTEEGWKEARRNREGLPWYKTAMGQAGQNRN
jgi:hypothetical protein